MTMMMIIMTMVNMYTRLDPTFCAFKKMTIQAILNGASYTLAIANDNINGGNVLF